MRGKTLRRAYPSGSKEVSDTGCDCGKHPVNPRRRGLAVGFVRAFTVLSISTQMAVQALHKTYLNRKRTHHDHRRPSAHDGDDSISR